MSGPQPPPGLKRKGFKDLPKLPLSAFTPPNSGISENFPLPPSPSTVHPSTVVDASVRALPQWQREWAGAAEGRAASVVAVAEDGTIDGLKAQAAAAGVELLAVQLPFRLEDGADAVAAALAAAGPDTPAQPALSLATAFHTAPPSDAAVAALRAALRTGRAVDIDVQAEDHYAIGATWEGLAELLAKATVEGETAPADGGPIVLNGLLPPPHDVDLPIVKLLTHPSYTSFQAQVATLSLVPNTFAKFLPPDWNAPTPRTPAAGQLLSPGSAEDKVKKEWKRRIKMYLGPAVEAFGFERILFGSAPSPAARAASTAGTASDWYALARESLTELGIDQDAVDAIFCANARKVYGAAAAPPPPPSSS